MSKLFKSKLLFGVMIVAVMFVGAVAVKATPAAADCSITATLRAGSVGTEVACLQTIIGATADGKFGPMTKAAVMAWQAGHSLVADGVVGAMTRAALMGAPTGNFPAGCTSASGFSSTTGAACNTGTSAGLPAGCSTTSGYSPLTGAKCDSSTGGGSTSGPVSGGAGSITVDSLSTYSSEQVGEGDQNAKVLAFTVEADDNSDVAVSSVKVELKQTNTADSRDITDYIDSVSVWMGSEKVGSVASDTFSVNSHIYTKSIALSNAVVRAGEKKTFVIALDASSNLDSGDIDSDAFAVDVLNVRFEDGEGVVTTEDTDASALDQSFDFGTFATTANVELKVALNDADKADINDAHVINVNTGTSDTDGVEVLSFTMEAKGSDINIEELPVLLTTTGETDEAVILKAVHLLMNGDEIATETVPTGGAVTFNDLNIDISKGDKEKFKLTVDLQDLTGALDVGDTVKAEVTSGNVDAIVATDSSGDELATADLTGSASGSASEVRDAGFTVKYVSSSAVLSHAADLTVATDDDQGTFSVTFDVTAFDSDVYIDGTSPALAGAGSILDLTVGATAGTPVLNASTITSPSGATMTGSINADARFKVAEGTTERFTVTAVLTPSADAAVNMAVSDIVYALTDVTGDTSYTFGLTKFKTADLYLNQN